MFSEYKFKTELHAHTSPVSRCSQIPADEMADIYSGLGYTGLCITNHFDPAALEWNKNEFIEYYINDFMTVKARGEQLGLSVIMGVELRFTENMNDYLIFGVDENDLEEIYNSLEYGIVKFYKGFSNERRVILQAHPFRDNMELAPVASIDGIETFNVHPGQNSRVAFAAKYAREHNMLVSCGTDFHHPGHEGLAGILTKAQAKNSFELAAILKSRDYLLSVGSNTILPYER